MTAEPPPSKVTAGDLTVRMGDVKVKQPAAGRDAPVVLRVELAGRVRGGDITARPPRRSFGQWIRRESRA